MAIKIIWSEPALGDLASLTEFIAEDNPSAAEKTGMAILKRIANLKKYPSMGRVVPEIGRQDVRELVNRPFRIIYRLDRNQAFIEILRIWHGARGEPELE
jgi:plasmid stabilization system protein ParE